MNGLHVKIFFLFLLSVSLSAGELLLSGRVISENEKSISSRYMGYVQEVRVNEGDVVKKGDLLYKIDAKEIDSAIEQSNLAIAQAELSYEMYQMQYSNAKLNLERHQRLLEKDMVSQFEVENLQLNTNNLKTMMQIAQKQIATAKQKRLEVKNQYHYLEVRAPNDSVIIQKNIHAGEMALAGVPAFILSDISTLKISAEIPESYLGSVKVGDKASVWIASIGCKSEGVVEAIIPTSNPMTHAFRLKSSFTCNEATAYPGMYATVTLGGL
ncbi:efflux RND transporter periplasmic adaptor subunit [Sulfurospirillum barnesii]|uniref:RND family efflux transporter, MFP subunit n=1 Tax=Sulfurospirillum barnesii (strain ATCC 700032 / DSM 10660 / SES-3) TaxID=760154 RepID=I3XVK6_SULBS|nr:efflux RND transporter periplasmic adaptor subunit [Sulfurospirillum barnesii]AFL67980.1 RND family efflux transporter, MFP subunit [Sulfurospirillum barnesii SES-3]